MATPNDEMRLAVWRPAQVDRLERRSSNLRDYANLTVVALAAGASLPLMAYAFGLIPFAAGSETFLAGFLAGVSIAAPLLILFWYLARTETPLPVRDYGDGLNRMNVLVRLSYKGHVYAEDRGEMTAVDGWLLFEGARCDFSIAPRDVTAGRAIPWDRSRSEISFQPRSQYVFQLAGKLKDVQVLVVGDFVQNPSDLLVPWNWTWKHRSVGGISVLPPLDPMPGFWLGRFRADSRKRSKGPLTVIASLFALRFGTPLASFSPLLLAGRLWAILLIWLAAKELIRHRAFSRLAALRVEAAELTTQDQQPSDKPAELL